MLFLGLFLGPFRALVDYAAGGLALIQARLFRVGSADIVARGVGVALILKLFGG